MYFFKDTNGNWVLGPEPTSFTSKAPCTLRRNTPTVVTVRTIEKRVLLIDRTDVTAIKKNANGDFYANYAEFVEGVSGFFDNAPASGAKWKTYKALISRFGEDDPIERVLNQDEDDCLKLNNLHYSIADACIVGEIDIPEDKYIFVPKSYSTPDDADAPVDVKIVTNGGLVQIFYSYNIGGGEITDLARVLIEFSIKIRGTAPVLLSAETNTTGDKVILTFDKKMSGYGLSDSFLNSGWSTSGFETNGFGFLNAIVENNKVIVTISDPVTTSDTQLEIVYDATQIVESFDYGMLGEINNFQITNNVV